MKLIELIKKEKRRLQELYTVCCDDGGLNEVEALNVFLDKNKVPKRLLDVFEPVGKLRLKEWWNILKAFELGVIKGEDNFTASTK